MRRRSRRRQSAGISGSCTDTRASPRTAAATAVHDLRAGCFDAVQEVGKKHLTLAALSDGSGFALEHERGGGPTLQRLVGEGACKRDPALLTPAAGVDVARNEAARGAVALHVVARRRLGAAMATGSRAQG